MTYQKQKCDYCKRLIRKYGLIRNIDGRFMCRTCQMKRGYYDYKATCLGIPQTSFSEEMEKIHTVKQRSKDSKKGFCSFSKFLLGQEFILRGNKYHINGTTVSLPKELIGIKFKLHPERLEVVEIK